MRTPKPLIPLLFALVATTAAAQPYPAVVVSEPIRDLGVVLPGTTLEATFLLENRGESELRILSVEPDCGCTVVAYDEVIAPGDRGRIEATVDVSTFVGPIAKYLSVRTNDPANPVLALTIKSNVRPRVQVHPGYARFLTVEGEGRLVAEQTVWAAEGDAFEIVSARSPFDHVSVSFREATSDEERSEGQGRQWRVVVTLSEDAPVGPMADHVRLATNHPEARAVRIPVSGFVRPVLAVTPPAAEFGERDGSQPVIASLKVRNFSDDEIALLSATSDLPGLEVEIQPEGRDHYLILTLQPGSTSGPFSGLLTVQTDSPRVPTLEIEVSGSIL